jgi:pimeloyl-ACP methyl ester carboxylesterase
MGILRRTVSFAVALVTITAAVVAAVPQKALAATVMCDAGVGSLTNPNIGTEVPVVLVHGLSGNAQQWGSLNDTTTLEGKINNMPGTAVAHVFQYWSADPNSGGNLAKIVDCASRQSIANGGKGKVVIVGYSQGGIVARYALQHTFPDGHTIVDKVGQVVTLGSPNSWQTGIPAFPSQTTVYTIASNLTNVYRDWRGNVIERRQTNSDGLFATSDATFGWTTNAAKGGGTTIVNCEKYYVRYAPGVEIPSADATCEHGQMVSNKNSGVHKATTDAIKLFVDWLNRPIEKSLTVGALTTTYNSDWKNADYGASGPGQDAVADDTTNTADCTNCGDTTPVPQVSAFIMITKMDWCTGNLVSCMTSGQELVGSAPAVTVGGRTPDGSARYVDSGYTGTGLVWCFNDEDICITYRRPVHTPQLEPSAALLSVFSRATWAD